MSGKKGDKEVEKMNILECHIILLRLLPMGRDGLTEVPIIWWKINLYNYRALTHRAIKVGDISTNPMALIMWCQ